MIHTMGTLPMCGVCVFLLYNFVDVFFCYSDFIIAPIDHHHYPSGIVLWISMMDLHVMGKPMKKYVGDEHSFTGWVSTGFTLW